MENEPASAIYGNKNAPYLNGLLTKYARASAFADPLPDGIPSEPHYVWMEAGTNAFSDVTFTGDSDPSAGNSTKNTAHLTTQMMAATPPISWMGVMEGLNSSTGACPTSSSGLYGAKHDPFVFFQDIAGSPPSKSNALCAAHHAAFTSGQALVQGTPAQYTFISPNVCNDMHGDSACPSGDPIALGDTWLATNLPPLIDYVNAHSGVIFIVWDEPEGGSNPDPVLRHRPAREARLHEHRRLHAQLAGENRREDLRPPDPAHGRERQRLRRSVPARHASVGDIAGRGSAAPSRRRFDGQRVAHRRIVAAHDARDVGAAGIGVADDLGPVRDE